MIIFLAFGLRVHQLDHFGFWQDEGLTPLRAGYPPLEILTNTLIIQEAVSRDTHPPFYYLVIHLTQRLFGHSDFAYRYPSLLFGVLLIPLVYQLGRRLSGRQVGLLAAVLAAVNPLHIWYAQEARMYTLLALLMAAATYVLWRTLTTRQLSNQALAGRLALYSLLAGLAFYTHYTAVFVIGLQGIFWVGLLWRQGQRRLLVATAVVAVLIALPLVPFTLPRLFTGAEANYFYVPPWIMLQDVVHGFGLGLTVDFSQWTIKLLDGATAVILLAGVWSLARKGRQEQLKVGFILVYLLAAVIGLMLGSLIKPMYMGARHIMAGSPAFFLLAAWGIMALPRRPWPVLPWLALALLLLGPILSLNNLYHNPVYAKDDVRSLVRHVERQAGANDIVVYNNAILLALHWHYQERADLPVTALPIYPHHAGADTEQQLVEVAQQYGRIWYITDPPADGRDAGGVVEQWLADHTFALDGRYFHGRTMLVEAITYLTQSDGISEGLANGQPLALEWPGAPLLRGVHLDFEQPAALPTLWLDLYWQGGAPPKAGQQLRFILRGPDGKDWLDSSQPLQPHLAARSEWPVNGLVHLAYGLPVPAGTPPGSYELILQPWDTAGGSGEGQSLGHISLASSDNWPIRPQPPAYNSPGVYFAGGLELVGFTTPATAVRPGHPVPLTLYWRRQPQLTLPGQTQYQLEVIGPDGQALRTQTAAPGPDWLNLTDWPANSLIIEHTGLYFPPETAPGRYRLRWRLLAGDETIGARPFWRPWSSSAIVSGHIQVEPWPLQTTLPDLANPIRAAFGPAIELYGFELENSSPNPGDRVDLTLYWQAHARPDNNYLVFIHLVSAENGAVAGQIDRIPVDWLRPTQGWRPGEVLTDVYQLPLPTDLKPGLYYLFAGLYDPENDQRLPIVYQGESQLNHQLLISAITIP